MESLMAEGRKEFWLRLLENDQYQFTVSFLGT